MNESNSFERNKQILSESTLYGVFEFLLLLLEYVVLSYFCNFVFSILKSKIVISLFKFIVFIFWFSLRYANYEDFNIFKIKKPSRNLIIYIVMFFIVVGISWFWNGDIFNTDNLKQNKEEQISISLLLEYLLFFPIKEEFIFRAFGLSLLLKRTKNNYLKCCFVNGFLFGSFHLLNIFGTNGFSLQYILLQTLLSTFAGISYSMHLIKNMSILEVVLIHILNNAYAIIFPKDFVTNLSNSFVLFNFICNCLLIFMLFILNWK